jgi:trimethylamine--corrinoid protein Co-methyltransferase
MQIALVFTFEKFIADEDLCGALKQLMQPLELTDDAFAGDLIKEMGTSGNYLMQPHTLKRCRDEFFFPDLDIRTLHGSWLSMEHREVTARAGRLLEKRLAEYEKPALDPSLEKKLARYVANRKQNPQTRLNR